MKRTIISAAIALSCAACSGEDVQIALEKAQDEPQQATESVAPETVKTVATERSQDKQQVQPKLQQQPQRQQSLKQPEPQGRVVSTVDVKLAANQDNSAAVTIETAAGTAIPPEATIDPALLTELETSLAAVDDSAVMARYGEKGSGIDLQLGGSALSNYSVALAVSKRNLVSNVSSVSGATSIKGDPSGFGFTIALSGDYLFEFDKDALTPKAKEALESVLALYQEYDGTHIQIAGHTDSKGSDDYNLDLSKRRAQSVKTWFVAQGIANDLMTTQGYGETQPVAANSQNGQDYPAGRALNRRVDIAVKTKKKVNHLPTVSKRSAIQ